MSTGKKILNVFGIIFAWILSILLVVILYCAPILMSALSTIKPEKIVDTLGNLEISEFVESFDGVDTDNEEFAKFISTDVFQEIYKNYVSGLSGIFGGEPTENLLSEEKIKEIVHNHIDELYQMSLEEEPDLAKLPVAEAKQEIEELFSETMIDLVADLPSAEELRQQIMEENPEFESALEIFNQTDAIKMAYIRIIIVIATLVFVCRLHGFRGFRWLAVDLFVATVFSGLICAALPFVPAAIETLTEGQPAIGNLAIEFLGDFSMGVYIRTGIMLLSGVAMLVIYLIVKKELAQKKAETASVSVEQEQTV